MGAWVATLESRRSLMRLMELRVKDPDMVRPRFFKISTLILLGIVVWSITGPYRYQRGWGKLVVGSVQASVAGVVLVCSLAQQTNA